MSQALINTSIPVEVSFKYILEAIAGRYYPTDESNVSVTSLDFLTLGYMSAQPLNLS